MGKLLVPYIIKQYLCENIRNPLINLLQKKSGSQQYKTIEVILHQYYLKGNLVSTYLEEFHIS